MAKWDPWEWFKSNVVEPVSDFVGRAAKAIGTTFEKIVSTVGKTIEGVLKNPLPTIATIGLTMMGVPAPLANAMVTAATGGDMEQIVLSAAASYVGGKIGQQVGGAFAPDEIVGGAWGDEAFSSTFKPDLSQQLFQKIVTDASSGAATAALQGKNFDEILSAGVSSAVGSKLNTALKMDFGLNPNELPSKLISDSISSATKAILSNKDPATAIGDALGKTLITTSLNEAVSDFKDTYSELKTNAAKLDKDDETSTISQAQDLWEEMYGPQGTSGDYANLNDLFGDAQDAVDDYNELRDSVVKANDFANLAVQAYNEQFDGTNLTNPNSAFRQLVSKGALVEFNGKFYDADDIIYGMRDTLDDSGRFIRVRAVTGVKEGSPEIRSTVYYAKDFGDLNTEDKAREAVSKYFSTQDYGQSLKKFIDEKTKFVNDNASQLDPTKEGSLAYKATEAVDEFTDESDEFNETLAKYNTLKAEVKLADAEINRLLPISNTQLGTINEFVDDYVSEAADLGSDYADDIVENALALIDDATKPTAIPGLPFAGTESFAGPTPIDITGFNRLNQLPGDGGFEQGLFFTPMGLQIPEYLQFPGYQQVAVGGTSDQPPPASEAEQIFSAAEDLRRQFDEDMARNAEAENEQTISFEDGSSVTIDNSGEVVKLTDSDGQTTDLRTGEVSTAEDTAKGAAGEDTAKATGADTLVGGDTNDTLVGEGADDTLVGATGADTVVGTEGEDTAAGGEGADTVVGGEGTTKVEEVVETPVDGEQAARDAGFPSEYVYNLYNGDLARYQQDEAEYNGFPDWDTYLLYEGDAKKYQNDLAVAEGWPDADTKEEFKTLERYAQHLEDEEELIESGKAWAKQQKNIQAQLLGFPDYATYEQFSGDYSAYAQSLLPDTLVGGEGTDTVSDVDTLVGEGADDTLVGGTENDTLVGKGADDTLVGEGADDTLVGGDGNDDLDDLDDLDDDTLKKLIGDDTLEGGDGNDDLDDLDDDTLKKLVEDDTLVGGNGNDTVVGGAWGDEGEGESEDTVSGGQVVVPKPRPVFRDPRTGARIQLPTPWAPARVPTPGAPAQQQQQPQQAPDFLALLQLLGMLGPQAPAQGAQPQKKKKDDEEDQFTPFEDILTPYSDVPLFYEANREGQ